MLDMHRLSLDFSTRQPGMRDEFKRSWGSSGYEPLKEYKTSSWNKNKLQTKNKRNKNKNGQK